MSRVLALFSGSLASRVSARMVGDHPEVDDMHLLFFRSPFSTDSEALRQLVRDEWPTATLRTQSLKREYRRLVDPSMCDFSLKRTCVNCRVLLLGRAARYMDRVGAEYLVTGERLGENGVDWDDVAWVTRRLGLEGRILRPLCYTPDVQPSHVSAWADLDEESAFRTSDDEVADLAAQMGLDPRDPLSSSVRCKLTIPGFGERVTNLFGEEGFTLNALRLLDFTLYYKISPDTKVVIAMTEEEKHELQNLFLPQDLRVYPSTPHGPMALVRTDWVSKTSEEREQAIELAARITATHVSPGRVTAVPIYFRFESDDETLLVNAQPFPSCEAIGAIDGVDVMALAEWDAARA